MFKSFWYYGLLKPPLTPPDWVFLPVWSVLYFTMFAAALLYIFKPAENKEIGYVCFILQLIFNLLWTPAFFYMQNIFINAMILIIIEPMHL